MTAPATGDPNAVPPALPNNAPAAPAAPVQPPTQHAQPSQSADFAALGNILSALPERVAHAVREAMPQPPAAAAAPPAAAPTPVTPPADTKPGPSNFREWWFRK